MLVKLSNFVREAQKHALSCAERASSTTSAEAKKEWRQIEFSWTHLAESYLLVTSLQRYLLNPSDDRGMPSLEQQVPQGSRIAAPSSRERESKYQLLAEACRRKADAEPSTQGKLRWLELAEDWIRLSGIDESHKK